jgi:hypothetical protein
MADDGEMKEDVKVPEGEVGKKITDLFESSDKDVCKYTHDSKALNQS